MSSTSPIATGGGGTTFEFQVDAAMLALLLVGGPSFCISRSKLTEVHLQSGHSGWKTDDLLLVAENEAGARCKLLVQVKRTFKMRISDGDCIQTWQRAFLDFRKPEFSREHDRIVLITQTGSERFVAGMRALTTTARASLSCDDFQRRLTGYLPAAAREYYDVITQAVQSVPGVNAQSEELWRFITAFDFLVLDLATQASTAETLIRNILSATARQGVSAADSWNELVALAANDAQAASSYTRDTLSENLRGKHGLCATTSPSVLSSLKGYTDVVARGVEGKIGGTVTLPRREWVAAILSALEFAPVTLVTGHAGSGKSALSLKAFEATTHGSLGLAFRAEKFAGPHVNDSLAPFNTTIEGLELAFALHPQKTIWVESVERLLEKPNREAFWDLLRHVKQNRGWRLLLTCRSYAAETVKSALLEGEGVRYSEVAVPLLSDDELREVAAEIPNLQRPLADAKLKSLLKNPFLLDKAAKLDWANQATLPQTEHEFREKLWYDVIRRDEDASDGMPHLRGSAFEQVCLQRARQLESFVRPTECDPRALDKLLGDNLLASPTREGSLVAPAHDVLEDWALLHWLDTQIQEHQNNPAKFFEGIGTFPALRRTYRIWLAERLNTPDPSFDALILRFIQEASLAAHWREDTLAGVLRSSAAGDFLTRNKAAFCSNGLKLLRLAMRLIRVAGMTATSTAEGMYQIPAGPAWAALPQLLAEKIADVRDDDLNFIHGFLEDWSRLRFTNNPYPEGVEAVVKLVQRFLPPADTWDRDTREQRTSLLRILLVFPNAAKTELTKLVTEGVAETNYTRTNEDFLADVWNNWWGAPLAKDLPQLTIAVAKHELMPDREEEQERAYGGHVEIEHLFGLDHAINYRCFPPSAFQGPFLNLLHHHPEKGLDLVLDVLNLACEHYAANTDPDDRFGPPHSIELTLPNGEKICQWGNERLWGLYRYATVGPHALQCALMALEHWLLQTAATTEVGPLLVEILKRSNNVAATAVVASVCLAQPEKCSDAGLAVLSNRALFYWDMHRYQHDQRGPKDVLPETDTDNKLFEQERQQSAQLPHRKYMLEHLVGMLQLTPSEPTVSKLIDAYKAVIEAIPNPGKDTLIWKNIVHRMDLRNLKQAKRIDEHRVAFVPSPPPKDVAEMLDAEQPQFDHLGQLGAIWSWAADQAEVTKKRERDGSDWHVVLTNAIALRAQKVPAGPLAMLHDPEAYVLVAAVCLEEHQSDLSAKEHAWCINQVCTAIESLAGQWYRQSHHSMLFGHAPAMRALAKTISATRNTKAKKRALHAFAVALTQEGRDDVLAAVRAISKQIWPNDRELGLAALNAIAAHRQLVDGLRAQEEEQHYRRQSPHPASDEKSGEKPPETAKTGKKPGALKRVARTVTRVFRRRDHEADSQQQPTQPELSDPEAAIEHIRSMLLRRETMDEERVANLDPTDPQQFRAAISAVLILAAQPNDSLAARLMANMVKLLCTCWDEESQKKTKQRPEDRRLGYDVEHALLDHIAFFGVRQPAEEAVKLVGPFIERLHKDPKHTEYFVRDWISAQDHTQPTPTFWAVWEELAQAIRKFNANQFENDWYSGIVRRIFLDIDWIETARDWAPLIGEEHRITALFNELPASRVVFASYSKLLSTVGATALPGALKDIARKIRGHESTLLSPRAQSSLERVMSRLVYGANRQVRRDNTIRDAAIELLDALVNHGSSAAFKLRDDLLTPLTT